MAAHLEALKDLIDQTGDLKPIRVAVVDAAQGLVIETLREAHALGIVEPRLIGDPTAIASACKDLGWKTEDGWIVPAPTDPASAAKASITAVYIPPAPGYTGG